MLFLRLSWVVGQAGIGMYLTQLFLKLQTLFKPFFYWLKIKPKLKLNYYLKIYYQNTKLPNTCLYVRDLLTDSILKQMRLTKIYSLDSILHLILISEFYSIMMLGLACQLVSVHLVSVALLHLLSEHHTFILAITEAGVR